LDQKGEAKSGNREQERSRAVKKKGWGHLWKKSNICGFFRWQGGNTKRGGGTTNQKGRGGNRVKNKKTVERGQARGKNNRTIRNVKNGTKGSRWKKGKSF